MAPGSQVLEAEAPNHADGERSTFTLTFPRPTLHMADSRLHAAATSQPLTAVQAKTTVMPDMKIPLQLEVVSALASLQLRGNSPHPHCSQPIATRLSYLAAITASAAPALCSSEATAESSRQFHPRNKQIWGLHSVRALTLNQVICAESRPGKRYSR